MTKLTNNRPSKEAENVQSRPPSEKVQHAAEQFFQILLMNINSNEVLPSAIQTGSGDNKNRYIA